MQKDINLSTSLCQTRPRPRHDFTNWGGGNTNNTVREKTGNKIQVGWLHTIEEPRSKTNTGGIDTVLEKDVAAYIMHFDQEGVAITILVNECPVSYIWLLLKGD